MGVGAQHLFGFLGVSETLRMAGHASYGLKGMRFVLFILIPATLPSILAI